MNSSYRTARIMLVTGLLVFGSSLLSGCSVKLVDIDALIGTPESYIGSRVKVSGEIYDIVREGGNVIGKSFTVRLTSQTRSELLECEFARGENSPPHHLRDGQWVTITGVVDIVQGRTLLRECRIE